MITYNNNVLTRKSQLQSSPPPLPRSMLDSAMHANLCSTLQFVSNIERWEREVGLVNASEYQQFDKDCSCIIWNTESATDSSV